MESSEFYDRLARMQHSEQEKQAARDQEEQARRRAEVEAELREERFSQEALRIGQGFAELLTARNIPTEPIYDTVETGALKTMIDAHKGGRYKRTYKETDIRVVDQGWVILREAFYSIGRNTERSIYGLTRSGELLTGFQLSNPYIKGNHNQYPNGVEGIINPRRLTGRHAFELIQQDKIADGVVWLAAGNEVHVLSHYD